MKFLLALRVLFIVVLVAASGAFLVLAIIEAATRSLNFEAFVWTGLILICGWWALDVWERKEEDADRACVV